MNDAQTRGWPFPAAEAGIRQVRTPGPREKYSLRLLDQVRIAARRLHYSIRTEDAKGYPRTPRIRKGAGAPKSLDSVPPGPRLGRPRKGRQYPRALGIGSRLVGRKENPFRATRRDPDFGVRGDSFPAA
jgi:hypothetical protein